MDDKVTVGIFWLCDDGGELEILYAKEECDTFGEDDFVTYSRQHVEAWEDVKQEQFNGKYSGYKYYDFPCGRIVYDRRTQKTTLYYGLALMPYLADFNKKLEHLFNLKNYTYRANEQYTKFYYGRYHKE